MSGPLLLLKGSSSTTCDEERQIPVYYAIRHGESVANVFKKASKWEYYKSAMLDDSEKPYPQRHKDCFACPVHYPLQAARLRVDSERYHFDARAGSENAS